MPGNQPSRGIRPVQDRLSRNGCGSARRNIHRRAADRARRDPAAPAGIRKLTGATQQRQLVAVVVRRAKVADHFFGLEHTGRLSSAPICAGVYRPEVVTGRERRRAVLRVDPVDLLEALRIDTQDFRRTSIRADDEIPDPEFTDRPETAGGQHLREQRLRAAPHICQRRDLDDPGAHQLWDQLGIHHVV